MHKRTKENSRPQRLVIIMKSQFCERNRSLVFYWFVEQNNLFLHNFNIFEGE